MNNIELSIIIVDYNCRQYIKKCIESISRFLNDNYEIIVVDNNSLENFTAEYEKLNKQVKTFYLKENKGFGAANNFGAKQARGKYLLLLNPDTYLVDNSICSAISFLNFHPEIGAMTCLLYQDDEKTLQNNFFGNFQNLLTLIFKRKLSISPETEYFYTDIVTGAALFIERKKFNQIHGFDENIFMYLEDDDLCKRLVKCGYKNAVYKKAKIIHLEGKSFKNNKTKKRMYYKSQNYYWKKHKGLIASLLMCFLRLPKKIKNTI